VRLRTASGLLIATLALSSLALLWRFAAEPIEHGYTRYAGLAAEMLRSGDWIVMRAAGQLYLNKPPLYVWLIAAPMSLLGRTSALAQHAPDVLAFPLTLGFTWAFARRWFGSSRAGLSAALVLASSVGFSFLTRGKRIDPLCCCSCSPC
jgi:4-amino-4-deoxy-L-arabinose transferase-like glycosyltransferase